MKAFVAAPQTREKLPAVIVVQEWWGLTDHIKDIARRYAAEGYVAISPALFSRLGPALTTDAGQAGKHLNTPKQEAALADPNASVAYLKSVPEVETRQLILTL